MDYLLNSLENLQNRVNLKKVLNLIINGLSSKQKVDDAESLARFIKVLNLIINGLSSKL